MKYLSSSLRVIIILMLMLLPFSINPILNFLSTYVSSVSLYLSALDNLNVSTSSFGFIFWIFISLIVLIYANPLTFEPFKFLLFLNILIYLVTYYSFPMAARFFAVPIALLPLVYSDLPRRLQSLIYSSFLFLSILIISVNLNLL